MGWQIAVHAVDDPAPVKPPEEGQVGVEVKPPGEVGDVAGAAQSVVCSCVVVEAINPMLPECQPVVVAADD